MFSSLSKGSVLYGLDKRDGVTMFTAVVDNINIPFPNMLNMGTIDITATVNGKKGDFKQIPCANAIYDLGSVVLADNKDSLVNYVTMELQNSKSIVSSVDNHRKLITQYESILSDLNPSSGTTEVRELKGEISELRSQLAEALSLLKRETPNTKEI